MKYVEYGRTGKKVSVVGFGGMRFAEKRPDEENAELVRYACSQGINYFDTHQDYKTEQRYGELLPKYRNFAQNTALEHCSSSPKAMYCTLDTD